MVFIRVLYFIYFFFSPCLAQQEGEVFHYFDDEGYYYLAPSAEEEGTRAILMEWYRHLEDVKIEAQVRTNSCLPPGDPRPVCTFTLSQWVRSFAYIWENGPTPGRLAKAMVGSAITNRMDHYYWKRLGFDYPLDSRQEDTLSCTGPLLPENPSSLYVPTWVFQHELNTREYLFNERVSRLVLNIQGAHFHRTERGDYRLGEIESLGLPLAKDATSSVWAFRRVESMGWVFPDCRVSFDVFSRSSVTPPSGEGEEETFFPEQGKPLEINPVDYHQYFSNIFSRMGP